jgi:hypothetical protein
MSPDPHPLMNPSFVHLRATLRNVSIDENPGDRCRIIDHLWEVSEGEGGRFLSIVAHDIWRTLVGGVNGPGIFFQRCHRIVHLIPRRSTFV